MRPSKVIAHRSHVGADVLIGYEFSGGLSIVGPARLYGLRFQNNDDESVRCAVKLLKDGLVLIDTDLAPKAVYTCLDVFICGPDDTVVITGEGWVTVERRGEGNQGL